MVIVPGIIHQVAWYTTTSIPDDYHLVTSEKSYSNNELSLKWLVHFKSFPSNRQIGSYRLLLLDGFGSHCTKQIIDYCNPHKIVVFCLPPHSSHLLQPLDVVVFEPYKHYHAEAVEAATHMRCGNFDKIEFLDQIESIRQRTFKPSTIQSTFRAIGLIQYDSYIVLYKLREAVPGSSLPNTEIPDSDFAATGSIPLTI